MFFVSALGLMIHISPPDARGRIAGMFTTSFLLGAVAGPVFGSLIAGWGLAAPFLIYGVVQVGLVAVVFYSLRRSALAAPADGSAIGGDDARGASAPRVSVGAVL